MPKKWTREEEILALMLYCEIPFKRISSKHPKVKQLADILGRTPASVSMKMDNFARFDPILQNSGKKGLSNGSKLDEDVWNEFNGKWGELVKEGYQIRKRLSIEAEEEKEVDNESNEGLIFPEGSTRNRVVEIRSHQAFFRRMVLASYENRCCITGLMIPSLLIASHIKPWKDSDPVRERTNPMNGLCLNALHDKAFDRGLITVTPSYRIRVSSTICEQYSDSAVKKYFEEYDGKQITLPHRFAPAGEYLEYHNRNVFIP